MEVLCAVKYGKTEAEGCLIGIKSDTLIRMVAFTNVDIRAGPGQSRVGQHSSEKILGTVAATENIKKG